MKDCPACGEKIKDDALKCKFCSVDLNLRKCPWCAEIIEKNAKKCKHCKSFVAKLNCTSCGDAVEIAEMRCPNCVAKMVVAEVEQRVAAERRKLDLKNWLILAVLVALGAFALSEIF
ncbi:MAG: zinc ribbon domain-containing protein [Patescibacteria group bacterium]